MQVEFVKRGMFFHVYMKIRRARRRLADILGGYFSKASATASFISLILMTWSWRIGRDSRPRKEAGIGTPVSFSTSSMQRKLFSDFGRPMDSATLSANLYGLAVDAMSVGVWSPVCFLYCS